MSRTILAFTKANTEDGSPAGDIYVSVVEIESFEAVPLGGPIIIGQKRPSVTVLRLKSGRQIPVTESLGDIEEALYRE